MKVLRFFHSTFTKHLIFIFCTLSASNAFAYLKVNIHSSDFNWQNEQFRFDGEDYANDGDFFMSETINFDIALVIPEFEYSGDDVLVLTHENPVVDIKVSNLFGSLAVTNSRFELELTPWEDEFYTAWYLAFDVIDQETPQNGTASGGSFAASGGIEWRTDGSGSGTGYGDFNYYLDNWVYRRHAMEWVLDSDVHFTADPIWLTIEKISAPEPFSPGLLLTGLAFIIFARRQIKQKR